MNGEFPSNNPRAELEARVTAFILGELPAHEAAALRQAMDEDVELSRLYERLKETIGLVREATANPVSQAEKTSAPLRLSEERREKLLAHFKTVAPKEFVREERKRIPARRILEIAAVVAIIGILAALLLPALSSAKYKARSFALVENLRQIDGAKQQWALEMKAPDDAVPTESDIQPFLGRGNNGMFPEPVAGEKYKIGPVSKSPRAAIPGKQEISLEDDYSEIVAKMKGKSAPPAVVAPRPSQAVAATKEVAAVKRNLSEDITILPAKTAIVLPQTADSVTTPTQSGYVNNSLTWNPGGGPSNEGIGSSDISLNYATTPGNKQQVDVLPSGKAAAQVIKQGFVDLSALPKAEKEPRNEQQEAEVITLSNADVRDVALVLQNLFTNSTVQTGSALGSSSQNTLHYNRSHSFQAGANSSTTTPFGAAGGGGAGGRSGEAATATSATNFYAGDPDWIGFLEHPEQRHSNSNQFLARGAAITLPQGQKLDLDYIHSQASNQNPEFRFYTDVNGKGSYETNPAAPSIGPATGFSLARLSDDGSLNTTFDPGRGVPLAPATEDELRRAAQAESPPNVTIHAKFAEITQEDSRALGFTNQGIASGGTLPSFNGAAGSDYASNPSGAFPGPASAQSRIVNEGTLTNPEVTTESGRPGVVAAPSFTALTAEQRDQLEGTLPSQGVIEQIPSWHTNEVREATLVQDGKLLFEAGKYSEAEEKLRQAAKEDPSNVAARQYLQLVKEKQLADATGGSQQLNRKAALQVENAWDVEKRNGKLGPKINTNYASDSGAWSLSGAQNPFYTDNYDIAGEKKDDAGRKMNLNYRLTPPPASAAGSSLTSGSTRGWTSKTHNQFGNVGVADGSVQQFTVNGLRSFANHTGDTNADPNAANWSLFAGDDQPAGTYTFSPFVSTNYVSGFSSTNGVLTYNNGTDAINAATDEAIRGEVSRYDRSTQYRKLTNEAAGQQPFRFGFTGDSKGTTNYPNSTDLGAVTVSVDPDTKRTFFITDEDTSTSVSNVIIQLNRNPAGKEEDVARRLDEQIKQQEARVDGLRKELNVLDTEEQGTQPGNSLGPVNVVHYNSLKIDAQTQYVKQEKLLNDLQKMDKEQLKEALPKISPDPILKELVQGQADSETRLTKLKKELGPDNPDVKLAEKEDEDYGKQIDARMKGIVQGLEVQSKFYLAQMQNADALKEARTNDIGVEDHSRPYYEAKEELARLKAERATLAVNDSTKIPINYEKAADINDALKTLGADGKKAESNPAYQAKKQELAALKKEQEVMALQAAQASVERTLPTTQMVEVIERAEDKKAQNKTLKLRSASADSATETARIKIERDVTDVPGADGQSAPAGVYDPYFVQTEFEAIQSEKVLDQVIEKLKLNEAWAKKGGSGTPLSTAQTRQFLKGRIQLKGEPNSNLVDISVWGEKSEAAKIANTIAEVYADYRKQQREAVIEGEQAAFKNQLAEQNKKIAQAEAELAQLEVQSQPADAPLPKPAEPAPIPQPEVSTSENAFSTFSLNIADVSFKLAAASLEKDQMPEPASIRSEEFINAFDYRDPEPAPGAPLGFAWERARYPFAHNRDLLRFSVKTAAAGREAGRPMNIVLLLDKSGSMERADRVKIIHEALRVLATQLGPQDKISVVTFARVARLWVDGLPGNQAGEVADGLDKLTPEGGTNLEDAMRLAYETARRHYIANGINRVVLLTDGAANLGNVDPESLRQKAEQHRKEGVALDCFGVGWEGYNDDLLEVLSRNGGGRYGFLNTPEEAASGFATQLAGALHVAASDLKVQVEFNPKRVTAYRQIGYAKHQLTKEQFRDNTVAAAQVGAAESGNGLYVIEVNPNGEGPLATVRVRYKVPGTEEYPEHEWVVPYEGNALPLDQGSPAMRLAATASAFSEWLAASPFAGDVTTEQLLGLMHGVPETYGADERPKKLELMIRQAGRLSGK